jgi:hypothetical protein
MDYPIAVAVRTTIRCRISPVQPSPCSLYRVRPFCPSTVNNATTLLDIQRLPTDNQIRLLLDAADPTLLRPAFVSTFEYLQKREVLSSFRSLANTLLVALDATGYFYSESIHCPSLGGPPSR